MRLAAPGQALIGLIGSIRVWCYLRVRPGFEVVAQNTEDPDIRISTSRSTLFHLLVDASPPGLAIPSKATQWKERSCHVYRDTPGAVAARATGASRSYTHTILEPWRDPTTRPTPSGNRRSGQMTSSVPTLPWDSPDRSSSPLPPRPGGPVRDGRREPITRGVRHAGDGA